MDAVWTAIPAATVGEGGLADRRGRGQAFACGGTGFRQAHPRANRRSADPSEVMMSSGRLTISPMEPFAAISSMALDV
jgi:hypothetical protein